MEVPVPDPKSIRAKPVIVPTRVVPAGFPPIDVPPGHYFWLEVCGFHTFDEGLQFYTILGAFNEYVRHVKLLESYVDHMLVCISPKETHISDRDLPSNRHTLAHGLVTADKLTRKEALPLLLLIDHLLYCMPLDKDARPEPPV